jgi:vibriolysin
MLLGSACTVDADVDAQATGTQDSSLAAAAEGRGLAAIKSHRPDFLRGAGDLSFKRALVDSLGKSHERLAQSFRGVPVFGAQAIVHLNDDGSIASITDRLARNLKVDTTPKLRAEEAQQIAIAQVGGSRALQADPKVDLQILPESNGDVRLTYRVQLETRTDKGEPSLPNLFIDAHSG